MHLVFSLTSPANSSYMHACCCSRCCCHCAWTALLNGATGQCLHRYGYGNSWLSLVPQLAQGSGPTILSTGLSSPNKHTCISIVCMQTVYRSTVCNKGHLNWNVKCYKNRQHCAIIPNVYFGQHTLLCFDG